LILCLHPRFAGVQSCAVSDVTAAVVAVCCLPCLFSGNLDDFPFFIYVIVDVTAGVSGFEGGEVVFEVIWQFNI
jgi:hypothetical protein